MRILAVIVDALAAVLAGAVLAIVLTGGGVFTIAGQRVSATGADNPLIALAAVAALRYAALRSVAVFGRARWSWPELEAVAVRLWTDLERRAAISPKSAAQIVLIVAAIATLLKIVLAWLHPGFFSGDDVEVHEMSIGAIWRAGWPIWDLRNAVFPIGAIFPLQKLFAAAGLSQAGTLVFAGRISVAVLSSITIVLIWRAGRRTWPDAPGWALAAALLFAASQLHIAFGSSELPRPVATVFVVGAFVLLQQPGMGRVVIAALLLGAGTSLRFSEGVFVAPAALVLMWQRRWAAAFVLIASAAATALAIIGAADALYWGEPFHSLRAAFDYTVVNRLSSRGHQHVAWYFLNVFTWLSPAIAVLAGLALASAPRLTDLWIWVPVLVLSALPHKEARYMIPVVPFACLAAIRGLQIAVAAIRRPVSPGARAWRPVALTALLALGLAQDAGHWRLPRSNPDVAFARSVTASVPADARIAIEQAWRLGGRLYLHPREIVDLDPDRLDDASYLFGKLPPRTVVLLDSRSVGRHSLAQALRSHGYEPAPLSVRGSRYQMWVPAAPAAPGE